MKTYLEHVTDKLQLNEDDPKEIPKSALDAEKEEERKNALKSNIKKMMFGNIFVNISTHAASQAVVRRSDLEPKDWEIILKRIVNNIKQRKNGYYLYFSKSYEQGIIVYWNLTILSVITVLPKGRSNPKPGTDKIMIERFDFSLDDNDMKDYINDENIIEID